MDFTFNYSASQLYAPVHVDPNPIIAVRGCVGCGKTSGSVVHTFLKAQNQEPNSNGVRERKTAVVRATAPRLKTTVMKTYESWFGNVDDPYKGGILKWKRTSPMSARCRMPSMYNDGTVVDWEICFLALDREDDVEILKSQEFSDIYFCETMEMKRNIFDAARGRIGRYPAVKDGSVCTHPQIICDYNSPPIDHWLAKLELEERPEGHSFYVAPPAVMQREDGTWVPSPNAVNLEYLHEDYYKIQLMGADPQYIHVMLANNFGSLKSERRVFHNYDDAVHVGKFDIKPLRGVPIVIGLDAGLTPAAAICQLSPLGQLLVLDEIVTEDCGMSQFVEEYLKPKMLLEYRSWDYRVVVDPAATQRAQTNMTSCYDILRRAGIPVQTAKSNNPIDRIDSVDYFLRRLADGQPSFLLSPKCATIRRGLISEYKYRKVMGQDRFHNVPEKNIYSHVMDGLQYACLELAAPKKVRRYAGKYLGGKRFKPASSRAGY